MIRVYRDKFSRWHSGSNVLRFYLSIGLPEQKSKGEVVLSLVLKLVKSYTMKTQITVTLPTIEEVTFEIKVHEEHIPVRGNAIASDDDDYDKEVEDKIIDRLNSGDVWAWCTVEVIARYKGMKGNDFLGGCCYADENDFKEPGGYYDDMKQRAYEELISEIESLQD